MKYIKTPLILLSTLTFISCGENTQTQVTPEIKSIDIVDDGTALSIYATDVITKVYATVTYTDNTTKDATNSVKWASKDYLTLSVLSGEIWGGDGNGGNSSVTIDYETYSDSRDITVYALKENSLTILPIDNIATGIYQLNAHGDFINLDTNVTMDNNRTIVKNITWTVTNDALITLNEDDSNIVEVEFVNTGETNITASVFDFNTTVTYDIP